jgi:excinuclease ABC subunit A
MSHSDHIIVRNATENNLRSVTLEIPKNKLILVTGVSGSGKSSLIFDVLFREAESRYLGSFSAHARQFLGKMKRPAVEMIEGLSPAVAVGQQPANGNVRSTVGTMTGIHDLLRLLFARAGTPSGDFPDLRVTRTLFSFNSREGACKACKGLGVEDFLDPDLLIADPSRTLREGTLKITTPNGYIIYSQVTMDVLDQVCRSEGFTVDIPWKDLTAAQQHTVLYGSDKIEIPFGKHPLESRMKWSGITAKPREMGTYKGILPVMEAILSRDRNKNILRFVRSGECSHCKGTRFSPEALSVTVGGYTIADLSSLQLGELPGILDGISFSMKERQVAAPVIEKISRQVAMIERLGLGYLTSGRTSSGLSGGESRRLRLAGLTDSGLSGMIYILDEPSVGLHPRDTLQLITILKELRDQGNTVIVVEHDEAFIGHADWLVDIGPGPGKDGGQVVFNGPVEILLGLPEAEIRESRTLAFYRGFECIRLPKQHRPGTGGLKITGARAHNLKNIDVMFLTGALNVVTGVSGAGKSTLTHAVLGGFLRKVLQGSNEIPGECTSISGWERIKRITEIDSSPIGRTPRSNPATYTGLFDYIRDLFAMLPEAQARGFGKGRFSFNTEGGRCEACQGAGFQQVGMHFMGDVEVVCESCSGKRFDEETLGILYNGKNIGEILEMTIAGAIPFFADQPKILRYLDTMNGLGLGYLALGQRSSTLSGGEAQRIKLAAELARPASAHTLFILDEPTTGLHAADTGRLLDALNALADQGHTVILIEHHPAVIRAADRVIDLGPGSGNDGGSLVVSGLPEEVAATACSYTGQALKRQEAPVTRTFSEVKMPSVISFKGVKTNNLRNVSICIPRNRLTVITGVSGSGKSSFAFDTLYAEGRNRFLENYSAYVRTQLGMEEKALFSEVQGLTAAFAVDQGPMAANPRSTVATATGIHDLWRLLYSRIGRSEGRTSRPFSSLFSFNHRQGACPACDGLGSVTVCDPLKLVTGPSKSIAGGAIAGTRTGAFYGDPDGQYMATLQAAGKKHGIDFSSAWNDLDEKARAAAMNGTGDEVYEVIWEFRRNKRSGEHRFKGPWIGLVNLVNEEYRRKHADHRGEGMMNVMKQVPCGACHGARLCPEALSYTVAGVTLSGLSDMPVSGAIGFFTKLGGLLTDPAEVAVAASLSGLILPRLRFLEGLGLAYLSAGRAISGLSGGEARRIQLAGQLGSGLTGLTYVLDEPTMGLHPADTKHLVAMIRNLQEAGNTVVVVEHDREVILAADHVIEMGPGAGTLGGEVIAEGTPAHLISNPASVTGPWLKPSRPPTPRHAYPLRPGMTIRNALANNLKGFDLEIPAGGITVVAGVSGSGKSSLVFDVISAFLASGQPQGCNSIVGFEQYQRIVETHPRSRFSGSAGTPATYTGIFDRIRDLFSKTPASMAAKFGKNHFSYMNREGRCETCQGTGSIRVSMDFLSDVRITCETCNGKRYRDEVLAVTLEGKTIDDVLNMTASEAAGFFVHHRTLLPALTLMNEAGLGYLRLGQSLETLSGGEAQRLELTTELMKPGQGTCLYLFEEPTAGLHPADVAHLLALLHRLAANGHTLLVVEHNLAVIAEADLVVELGPEGGDRGGYMVARGTPEQLMSLDHSSTGQCLKSYLG